MVSATPLLSKGEHIELYVPNEQAKKCNANVLSLDKRQLGVNVLSDEEEVLYCPEEDTLPLYEVGGLVEVNDSHRVEFWRLGMVVFPGTQAGSKVRNMGKDYHWKIVRQYHL